MAPRMKLWVLRGYIGSPVGRWWSAAAYGVVGSAAPAGTAKCASATRIAVKPCACGAPLRGYGA